MPLTRHRVLLSAVASALTLYGMPTLAFVVPSFPVKLSTAESSSVAALACPGSSGRATVIDASVTTKHAASAEYADVTCGPEIAQGDTPVVARNYCEKKKERWSCSERTRFVVHIAKGQSTYMAIQNDSDISGRLTLVKHLVRLGRYREARDWFDEASRIHPERPDLSFALARLLAASPDDRVRDGQRAQAIVERLVQTGTTIDLGETMAMALAERGQFADAIAIQRQLVEASIRQGLEPVTRRLTANLLRYERGQACRTPWARTTTSKRSYASGSRTRLMKGASPVPLPRR